MITISKAYTFDSAHVLWDPDRSEQENEQVFGKCSRVHGHTYMLDVTVEGEVNERTGMILNYFDLDKIVKPIVDRLDHRMLNDIFDDLTTTENMVNRIAILIQDELLRFPDIKLNMVALQETPRTSAVWYAD